MCPLSLRYSNAPPVLTFSGMNHPSRAWLAGWVGVAAVAASGEAPAEDQPPVEPPAKPSFLSPAGVLAPGQHALFVTGDTELTGYPTVGLGWRVGLGGFADAGVEVAGIDKAFLGRLHGKVRLWESPNRRGFIGLRLRTEFKRHEQDVDPETFRPIDDFGPIVAPELSVGLRLGEGRQHAVYYATIYYLDVDVRDGYPLEHYYLPALFGYGYHHESGLHAMADAGVFYELGNVDTVAEWVPRFRLRAGWEF